MEHYDAQMAQRVWQRVRGEAEAPKGNVPRFLLQEAEAAGAYSSLSRQLTERSGSLKQLLSDVRRHMACLRGIRYLTTGDRPAEQPLKPRQEAVDTVLRRCYFQNLKLAADYRSCGDDPEYGYVFSSMADTKKAHCAVLLEIIGSMGK